MKYPVDMYVGRFAPSPTGRIHLGVARTSLAAWLDARARGGRILMRIEDIDLQRTIPGAAEEILADLTWLGLDWDEGPDLGGPHGPYVQSARIERYRAAISRLEEMGRVYACTCSRKEIALASSAPHGPNDEGPRYPGNCRSGTVRDDRPRSLRLRTEPTDEIVHVDRLFGACGQNVHLASGDFLLKRADDNWAYQLAVTVDDLEQGINAIVRGADLLSSTARQLLLRNLLDPHARGVETLHVPLILGPTGERLAKRDGAVAVADRRAQGVSAETVVGVLAASLGQLDRAEPIRARDLIATWDPSRIPKTAQMLSVIEP